jgi:hypothetical protein
MTAFGDTRLPSRFWAKVTVLETGCWFWLGGLARGYGVVELVGRRWMAHRLAYTKLVGPIPNELECDHLCRQTTCVNPDHIELVTSRENALRGDTIVAKNAAKTACPQGHVFTPKNTYTARGKRECRRCRNAATAKSKAKHRGVIL